MTLLHDLRIEPATYCASITRKTSVLYFTKKYISSLLTVVKGSNLITSYGCFWIFASLFHIFIKIAKKCFLVTTYMVISLACSSSHPHSRMLPVAKGLTFCFHYSQNVSNVNFYMYVWFKVNSLFSRFLDN